jgi:hypothetical protein
MSETLIERLRKRAEIRRGIPRGEPDRISDILEEAADALEDENRAPFSLKDFVRESNRIEGIYRDPTDEEIFATEHFLQLNALFIEPLVELVKAYQPNVRPRFAQGLDVRVGSHYPPRGGPHVQMQLLELLEQISSGMPPYLGHVAYETLHPFTDGNGRTGRAVWLWAMGGIEKAPLGFLHTWYYQSLQSAGRH